MSEPGKLVSVLEVLAETDRIAAKWYEGVVLILLVGAGAVLLIICIGMVRRWSRRQRDAIEQDIQIRRESRSSGRVDAWQAGSDRYVDQDKLSDDVPYDSEHDGEDLYDDEDDEDEGAQGPGYAGSGEDDEPTFQDEREERDPYDLFKDKPFQEADDEDDEDDDDEDFDPDEDYEDDDDNPRR